MQAFRPAALRGRPGTMTPAVLMWEALPICAAWRGAVLCPEHTVLLLPADLAPAALQGARCSCPACCQSQNMSKWGWCKDSKCWVWDSQLACLGAGGMLVNSLLNQTSVWLYRNKDQESTNGSYTFQHSLTNPVVRNKMRVLWYTKTGLSGCYICKYI